MNVSVTVYFEYIKALTDLVVCLKRLITSSFRSAESSTHILGCVSEQAYNICILEF